DDTVRRRQMRYLAALYSGNNENVFRSLLEILVPSERADPEGLRRDFFAAVRARQERRGTAHRRGDGGASPVAAYMIAIMRAARRHGYAVPIRILAMYRALLTAEAVAAELGSSVDLQSVGRNFVERLQSEETLHALDLDNLRPALLNYFSLWRDAPG